MVVFIFSVIFQPRASLAASLKTLSMDMILVMWKMAPTVIKWMTVFLETSVLMASVRYVVFACRPIKLMITWNMSQILNSIFITLGIHVFSLINVRIFLYETSLLPSTWMLLNISSDPAFNVSQLLLTF